MRVDERPVSNNKWLGYSIVGSQFVAHLKEEDHVTVYRSPDGITWTRKQSTLPKERPWEVFGMRDFERDKAKIDQFWEMDIIEDGDDIAEILIIAEYWLQQYETLRKEDSE